MLAQSFKSAADLGITEPQLSALQKTLVLLETEGLKHVPTPPLYTDINAKFSGNFNMAAWARTSECGTVCCIGGTAELISGVSFYERPRELHGLFYGTGCPHEVHLSSITPAQAATALRSYLTTGDAKWHEAVA